MMSEKSEERATTELATRPTYAPAALSMGVMMVFAGVVTHWTVSLIGAGLCSWALWSWMYEVCYEWGIRDES